MDEVPPAVTDERTTMAAALPIRMNAHSHSLAPGFQAPFSQRIGIYFFLRGDRLIAFGRSQLIAATPLMGVALFAARRTSVRPGLFLPATLSSILRRRPFATVVEGG